MLQRRTCCAQNRPHAYNQGRLQTQVRAAIDESMLTVTPDRAKCCDRHIRYERSDYMTAVTDYLNHLQNDDRQH